MNNIFRFRLILAQLSNESFFEEWNGLVRQSGFIFMQIPLLEKAWKQLIEVKIGVKSWIYIIINDGQLLRKELYDMM